MLEGIEFALDPGESAVLLGPNGSGKTTLLKTLVRTLRPTAGRVLLGGDDIDRLSYEEIARRVAFVPQEEPAEYDFLVRDVVTLGTIARSRRIWDSEEDRAAARDAMRLAECEELADRPITELSGGERQRVLIARALAQSAPVILLDEPTSHLDVAHQLAVATLVRKLTGSGRAVLAAVHDLNLAPRMADRAMLIDRGRMVMTGAVEEVLADPRLDEVYGVRFERSRDSRGLIRLHALEPA